MIIDSLCYVPREKVKDKWLYQNAARLLGIE